MLYRNTLSRFLLLLAVCASLLLCASCGKQAPTDSDAPEGCKRAANSALDFSFCYNEDWEIDRAEGQGMLSVKYNVGSRGTLAYASISAMGFDLKDSNTGANNYWDTHKTDLTDVYGDRVQFQTEKEETRLGGVPANRNRYTLTMSEQEVYAIEQVICVRSGNVYMVTLTVPNEQKELVMDCFETVLSTFTFS